jgi:hypothetical protein
MMLPSHVTVSTNWVSFGTGPITTLRMWSGELGGRPAPAGPALTMAIAAAATVTPIHPIDFRVVHPLCPLGP